MLSDEGECKWNAQCRAAAEEDTDSRRDGSLARSETRFQLHLKTLGTLKILRKEMTSWKG